ncbi:MAG: phosphatidylserine decarboxylase [Syntrophales bacterium]|nr:phosphatidylserine decarboxylase [Syntrophales bacterium]
MISISPRILICVVACILISTSYAAAKDVTEAPPIQALWALYENNQEFHTTMDQAFATIKNESNPWHKKKFGDLCKFFNDWYYLVPVNNSPTFDEFVYIKTFTWFYYKNVFGQQIVGKEPGLSWSRDFVAARGKFMNSKESAATIPQWIADPSIEIGQYVVPLNGFQSFNEFFVRNLKPGTRTVASPTDDSVIVAPTDCVLNMIDPLTAEVRIPTKFNQKLNVRELLAGSEYAKYFENGTAISCILLPDTYHHYHAVVSGKVVESREDVAGAYWGIKDFPGFIHGGNFGYGQSYSIFEHFRRGYFVIETNDYGYVAMIPVALDTIGSVVFEEKWGKVNPENPVPVHKGEKLGHFAYGGSLVITLIEQGVSSITVPQGQQIGVFKQKKSSASK